MKQDQSDSCSSSFMNRVFDDITRCHVVSRRFSSFHVVSAAPTSGRINVSHQTLEFVKYSSPDVLIHEAGGRLTCCCVCCDFMSSLPARRHFAELKSFLAPRRHSRPLGVGHAHTDVFGFLWIRTGCDQILVLVFWWLVSLSLWSQSEASFHLVEWHPGSFSRKILDHRILKEGCWAAGSRDGKTLGWNSRKTVCVDRRWQLVSHPVACTLFLWLMCVR